MADFFAEHPVPKNVSLEIELPDDETLEACQTQPAMWQLYFDGASRIEIDSNGKARIRAGAGIVLKSPEGEVIHASCSINKPCTNNEAKYEALIIGLHITLDKPLTWASGCFRCSVTRC